MGNVEKVNKSFFLILFFLSLGSLLEFE